MRDTFFFGTQPFGSVYKLLTQVGSQLAPDPSIYAVFILALSRQQKERKKSHEGDDIQSFPITSLLSAGLISVK